MIVQNPINKPQLVKFIQSLKNPKFTFVDVISKDDRQKVIRNFDTMVRNGPFTIILVKDQ